MRELPGLVCEECVVGFVDADKHLIVFLVLGLLGLLVPILFAWWIRHPAFGYACDHVESPLILGNVYERS